MSPSETLEPANRLGSKAAITGVVLALHAAGLWALQGGMSRPPEPQIIAAEVIGQFVAPPAPPAPTPAPPAPAVPPPAQPVAPAPKPQPQPKPPAPKPPVEKKVPLPKAIPDPEPAPNAPTGSLDTADSAPADTPAPPTAPAAPAAPASPPAPAAPPPGGGGGGVQLPSSNAAYLNNPHPAYPSISRRMNEQGKVVLRVLVDENGLPQRIEVRESSGYPRLDQAAVASVQRWKFVPGQRNGVPEAMWNLVPINFVLE